MLNILHYIVRGMCTVITVVAFVIDYINHALVLTMWKFVGWITGGLLEVKVHYPTMDEYFDWLFK